MDNFFVNNSQSTSNDIVLTASSSNNLNLTSAVHFLTLATN